MICYIFMIAVWDTAGCGVCLCEDGIEDDDCENFGLSREVVGA